MGTSYLLLLQGDGHGVQLPGEGERMVEHKSCYSQVS